MTCIACVLRESGTMQVTHLSNFAGHYLLGRKLKLDFSNGCGGVEALGTCS